MSHESHNTMTQTMTELCEPDSALTQSIAAMLARSGQFASMLALGGLLAVVMLAPDLAAAESTPIKLTDPKTGSFPDLMLENWKERSFNGNTQYEIVQAGGAQVLKGSSDDAASVLYKEEKISVKDTPWVNWSWRVENTLGPIDETTRAGDDYAARMYVVVSTGFMPWESIAVTYVWSSSAEKGTHWFSPFTEKSMMVALQSGDEELGQWKNERRNIVADFKEFFDMDIDEIDGYAVMVDSDNSDQMATGYFGNITFSEK